MNKAICFLFLLLFVVSNKMSAQTSDDQRGAQVITDSSPWYVGVGGGVSLGRGTFASVGYSNTRLGGNFTLLGGYKIDKLLSAEVSLDYTTMALGSYDCCQNLWLCVDGNRYFAPISGMQNYQYKSLISNVNMFGIGAHLNIDLLRIWNENSKWSALAIPAIYGICSSAAIKQSSTKVLDKSSFHFGIGLDLGAGYQISERLGARLTTGINYLTGSGIDGIQKKEHKTNYIWNSRISLTYNLK